MSTTFLKTKTFVLVVAAACLACMSQVQAADITVVVQNVQDNGGQVMVALYNSTDSFPDKMTQGQMVAAKQRAADGSVRVTFSGLPNGDYAVSAFHDRDNNGKLNTNVMGMPTEPYGFSRNAAGNFGPPSFQDAAFNVQKNTEIVVQLKQ